MVAMPLSCYIKMNKLYINSYCKIKDCKIWKDGVLVIDIPNTGIEEFCKAAYQQINLQYPKFFKMDNLSKIGLLGAEFLFENPLISELEDKSEVSIVLNNHNSSYDSDIKHWELIKNMDELASPSIFVYTLPNIVLGEICIKHKIKGEQIFLLQNDFQFYNNEALVTNLFLEGNTKFCLLGWINVIKENYELFLMLISDSTIGSDRVFSSEAIKNM